MARASKKKASRGKSAPKASSRKKAEVAEVEVVEEEKGLGLEDGMVIMTTLALVAAILMVDYQLADQFGKGTFF